METGWIIDNGTWYYLDKKDGNKVINNSAQDKEEKWFYLDSDDNMVTKEWIKEKNRNYYYLGAEGQVLTMI